MQTLARLLQLLDHLSNDLDQQIERLETFADLVESQIPIGPILATNLALDMTKWLALKRNRVWFDAHRNELGLGLFGGQFGQYLHCIDFHVLLDWNGTTIYKFGIRIFEGSCPKQC